ncbi:MAG: methyltransferase domain-containing protein [Verrucomicrobia bacterium]|nr:methyltransferase domain-containing protein [Verrucomicrobiota bacterium]MBS0637157.1 methyltransferase domain-containing protein [Verrucomicrobiota bacterium]
MAITAREAAFLALDTYFLEGVFIEESLERFKNQLSQSDFGLAYELASGVIRQKRALEKTAARYASLPKKRKEKILLYMALYQQLYLDRIPDFAVGNEMVQLAKKHASALFAKFLNAFLRNQKCVLDPTPSYTDYFITTLEATYDEAQKILELGNKKPPLFARDRKEMKMVPFERYVESDRYYFQNPTQFLLYSHLKGDFKPKRIVDLAASPGGKTLLLHDFFPEATLYANDISEKRVALIKENCKKYGFTATLSTYDALDFVADAPFDLVVLDAPCTNSGCLYKCPEARWRLTEESVAAHAALQKKLLEKACTLGKTVWYSTCSILPAENQDVVAPYNPITQLTILPNDDGLEGGFAAVIQT